MDVPDALLEDSAQLDGWFTASHAYVSNLRPKPTTRGSTGSG